jgi:hypothetical protein
MLAFYPRRFQQEFGVHMRQVFRDCSLQAYRQSGAKGMVRLWIITSLDWLKTVIEEQSSWQVEMSRAKLMRLCGWSLMAGPVVLFVGLGEPAQYRDLISNVPAESLDPARISALFLIIETALILFILLGLIFIYFGFWGLRKHYQGKVRKIGRLSLHLLVISSGVSLLGAVLSLTRTELWWMIFIAGFLLCFVSLAIFGIAALREKPFTRWNALPFITGVWLPGMLVIGSISGWEEHPYFIIISMLFSLAGLILLGYLLQSDANIPSIAERS